MRKKENKMIYMKEVERMPLNNNSENLDDIFLTKDKFEKNNGKVSEEKARETNQIVDNLKKMQEPGKRWNEEQKNEVHYERNGLVRFDSLTKQKPRKIKRGKSYQVFMENIDIYLDSNEVRLEIKKTASRY